MRVLGSLVAVAALIGVKLWVRGEIRNVANAIHPPGAKAEADDTPLATLAPELAELGPGLAEWCRAAEPLAPRCKEQYSELDRLLPLVVWDAETHELSRAHGLVPMDRRASDLQQPALLALIVKKERKLAGKYYEQKGPFGIQTGDETGSRGYRMHLHVCFVEWPSKKLHGRRTVPGDAPPQRVDEQDTGLDQTGPWEAALAKFATKFAAGPKQRGADDQAVARKRNPPTPPALAGLAPMAQRATAGLARSRPMQSHLPPYAPNAIVWQWNPRMQLDRLHEAHEELAEGMRARPGDAEFVVFFDLGAEKLPSLENPGKFRMVHAFAAVAMPGSVPLGLTSFRGADFPAEEFNRNGGQAYDTRKELAKAIERFLLHGPEKPAE